MTTSYIRNTPTCAKNFHRMKDDRPQQLHRRDLEKAKVILIGHTETRSDHIKAIAHLLNSIATKDDLLLIEYLDRGSMIPIESPRMGVLNLLKRFGLRKHGLTIKGWDETRFGPEIALMLSSQKPLDYNILITQRNVSLAQAVHDDYSKFNKIFVLAGTLHFCIPPDFPDTLRSTLLGERLHKRLYTELSHENPLVIVPENKDGSCGYKDLSFDDLGPRRKLNPCSLLKVTLTVALVAFSILLVNRSIVS